MSNNQMILLTVLPLFAFLLAIFGASWLSTRSIDRSFDLMNKRMDERDKRMDATISSLEKRMDERFNAVDARFTAVESRLDRIERQLEQIFKPVLPR